MSALEPPVLFICFLFLFWAAGSSSLEAFSLVVVSEGYASLQHTGFSFKLLLLQSTGSRASVVVVPMSAQA